MNIGEAKDYFVRCGCNGFYMSRENHNKYEEYRALKISRQIEKAWRIEQCKIAYDKLIDCKESDKIRLFYSRFSELYIDYTIGDIVKMIRATLYALKNSGGKEREIVKRIIKERKQDRKTALKILKTAMKYRKERRNFQSD